MDVFKPKDRKRYIEYAINKFFKNEHKKKFVFVLNELKNIRQPFPLDLRYKDNNWLNIIVLIIYIFVLIYNT